MTASAAAMTDGIFLAPPEVADLTGYVQPAAQVRWLQKNGVKHYVRADGQVRVPRAFFQDTQEAAQKATEPNFAALRARH